MFFACQSIANIIVLLLFYDSITIIFIDGTIGLVNIY